MRIPPLFSLSLFPATLVANSIETIQPTCPAFIRQPFNPVLGFRIHIDGNDSGMFETITLGFEGASELKDIASFQIFAGTADPSANAREIIAESRLAAGKGVVPVGRKLTPGDHWFWISPELKSTASIDGSIDAAVFSVTIDGKSLVPPQPSPEGSQRIGEAVRLPGDDGSKFYRIPGLSRTKAGSLLAVYDIRYRHAGDLPADIDVGTSRSTDGGQSWEPMRIAIDMGNDPKLGYDGVGDPAILVDPQTGRIWVAALWSHGNRGWAGSGPGISPADTGQLVLVHSDDDGRSWSPPVNITPHLKDPAWRLMFNGPGAGIALSDGSLAFAAQYRAADGKPWSTLIRSTDHGETWQIGSGVRSDTTEAQLVELADGSVMINCRDNRGGSRTVATTRNFGKTWLAHPTDRSALRDPVCMASLLRHQHPVRGELIFFSNPDSTTRRDQMTVKLSRDGALSWPADSARLFDSRGGFGYSCLAMADDEHLGVLYEGNGSLLYLRFPLDSWFR